MVKRKRKRTRFCTNIARKNSNNKYEKKNKKISRCQESPVPRATLLSVACHFEDQAHVRCVRYRWVAVILVPTGRWLGLVWSIYLLLPFVTLRYTRRQALRLKKKKGIGKERRRKGATGGERERRMNTGLKPEGGDA